MTPQRIAELRRDVDYSKSQKFRKYTLQIDELYQMLDTLDTCNKLRHEMELLAIQPEGEESEGFACEICHGVGETVDVKHHESCVLFAPTQQEPSE